MPVFRFMFELISTAVVCEQPQTLILLFFPEGGFRTGSVNKNKSAARLFVYFSARFRPRGDRKANYAPLIFPARWFWDE